MDNTNERRPVAVLAPDVARKIAAGEVIDRPAAIVRELMDNAVDSGANQITVSVDGGGIEKIRVIDNGCGMTKQDLATCAQPHATSKITTENDLLSLSTLGFRGEALASMAAVSRLEITSGGWKLTASAHETHRLAPCAPTAGTIVQTAALFEAFPARRVFLKRPASEGALCRSLFEEKALPRPDIAFKLIMDGEEKADLSAGQTLIQRFVHTLGLFENERLFYKISDKAGDGSWSFDLVIGEPSVARTSRKNLYIYVNGRRIQEFSLMQAIEYGSQGYFPNGLHPAGSLFVTMAPALVDFNIHPAKREARFKDSAGLHHGISTAVRAFFKDYTARTMLPPTAGGTTGTAQLAFSALTQEGTPPKTGTAPKAAQNGDEMPMERMGRGAAGPKSAAAPGIATASAEHGGHRPLSYKNLIGDSRSRFFGGTSGSGATAFERIMQVAAGEAETGTTAAQPEPDLHRNYASREAPGSFHFAGSALGTFLIAEKNDTLYIIDQHAAHERILYNEIMENAGQKQKLLLPYMVPTENAADDKYLEAMQESLEKAGFTGKRRPEGAWEFSTVPVRWTGSEADLAHDLLDRRMQPLDLITAVAASTACRNAVKDGTVLDPGTAAWIAEQALELPDPHCPHGRPVFTTITRAQLFSLVKRT